MARGGSRPGAGRKKGSPNRPKFTAHERARTIATNALERESTPLSVMLEAMEFFVKEARKAVAGNDAEEASRQYAVAAEMAKKAAPYVHPALASTEVRVNRVFEDAVLSVDEAIRRAAELDDDSEGNGRPH